MLRSTRYVPRPVVIRFGIRHLQVSHGKPQIPSINVQSQNTTKLIDLNSLIKQNTLKYVCTKKDIVDMQSNSPQTTNSTTHGEPNTDLVQILKAIPEIAAPLVQARDISTEPARSFAAVLNASAFQYATDPDPLFACLQPAVPRMLQDKSDLRFLASKLNFERAASEFKNRSEATDEVWGYLEMLCKYKQEEALADALTFMKGSRHFTDEVAVRMVRLMIKWNEKTLLTKLIQDVMIPRFENPRVRFQQEQLEVIMEALAKVPHPNKDQLMTALFEKLKSPKAHIYILEHIWDVTKNFAKMEIIYKSYFETQKFTTQESRIFEIMIESALTMGTDQQVQYYMVEMKRAGLKFTGNVLHVLLKDALRQKDLDLFNKYFLSAQHLGVVNDEIYTMTFKLLLQSEDVMQSFLLFKKMMLKKIAPSMNLITDLVHLISKKATTQSISLLQIIYFLCVEADLVLSLDFYNALLAGFSQKMLADECIDIYNELIGWDLSPTNQTTGFMLDVLCPFAWRVPMYIPFLVKVVNGHLKTPELDPKLLDPALGVFEHHAHLEELLKIYSMWQSKGSLDFPPLLHALATCYEKLKMDSELQNIKKILSEEEHKPWVPTPAQITEVDQYMFNTQELEKQDRAVAVKPEKDDPFNQWVLEKAEQTEQQMEEQLLI